MSLSRLGHDAVQRPSFHRFDSLSLATATTYRFGAVRIGLVILPSDRWEEARRQWEWADAAGFCTAWTYDHIRWGGMPDGPWHAAVPVLAAASADPAWTWMMLGPALLLLGGVAVYMVTDRQ